MGCQSGVPLEGCSDDGLWCNGEEHCDEALDQCYADNVPCGEDQFCDEENEECIDVLPIFADGFESGSTNNWS